MFVKFNYRLKVNNEIRVRASYVFTTGVSNPIHWQVYQGLDVLTNKVPVQDQKGPCFVPFTPPVY